MSKAGTQILTLEGLRFDAALAFVGLVVAVTLVRGRPRKTEQQVA